MESKSLLFPIEDLGSTVHSASSHTKGSSGSGTETIQMVVNLLASDIMKQWNTSDLPLENFISQGRQLIKPVVKELGIWTSEDHVLYVDKVNSNIPLQAYRVNKLLKTCEYLNGVCFQGQNFFTINEARQYLSYSLEEYNLRLVKEIQIILSQNIPIDNRLKIILEELMHHCFDLTCLSNVITLLERIPDNQVKEGIINAVTLVLASRWSESDQEFTQWIKHDPFYILWNQKYPIFYYSENNGVTFSLNRIFCVNKTILEIGENDFLPIEGDNQYTHVCIKGESPYTIEELQAIGLRWREQILA